MPYVGPAPTPNAPKDLQGGELILDADNDTTITADTDDQIDIKIAGSDEIKITAAMIAPASADGSALGGASNEWSDLYLADSSVIYFGADQEITLTHAADDGLILKHVGTGDGKEPSLTFQAGDNDIAADDVLGSIFFQAPDEGAGTDAVLVAAGIEAVSEGDFSSSNNATKLSFKTAASEAASEKMALSSAGNLTVAGTIVPTGAITANAGVVVDNITIDGTEIDLSSGDLTLDVAGTIILNADSGSINLVDASTTFAELVNSSSDFIVKSSVSDKDLIFKGVDGVSLISALTLDMSDAGSATFNNKVTVGSNSSAASIILNHSSTTGNNRAVDFNDGDSTLCGSININSGTNAVSFETSSDYRLKENVVPLTGALARLKTLKPKRFNFISDETNTLRDGFLAHEAQSVVDESVSGTKDQKETKENVVVNNKGNVVAVDHTEAEWTAGKSDEIFANDTEWFASKEFIRPQGIDQSKLVPLLTAALQESVTKIETLETKVAALEAG